MTREERVRIAWLLLAFWTASPVLCAAQTVVKYPTTQRLAWDHVDGASVEWFEVQWNAEGWQSVGKSACGSSWCADLQTKTPGTHSVTVRACAAAAVPTCSPASTPLSVSVELNAPTGLYESVR